MGWNKNTMPDNLKKGSTAQADTKLEFKQHKPFFDTLYSLRATHTQKVNEFLSNDTAETRQEILNSFYSLIDWTNAQIKTYGGDVTDFKQKIRQIFQTHKKDSVKCYEELDEIYQEISFIQSQTEILPKVQTINSYENQKVKFWVGEEVTAIKELKKAWADLFIEEFGLDAPNGDNGK